MPYPLLDLHVTRHIPTNAQATNQVAMIAPFDLDIVFVETRQRVASTSGTLDVVVTNDAAAVSAGTSVLTGTISLSGTADTKISGSLKTGIGATRVNKGQAIGLLFAGTLTNLADLDITIVCRQRRKNATYPS